MREYLRKTWRGEQGLTHTFWIWTAVAPAVAMLMIYLSLNLVIVVIEAWTGEPVFNIFSDDLHPVFLASLYFGFFVLSVCVIYGLVSLWRAASQADRWGTAAKVGVTVIAVAWTVYFAGALASIMEAST